MGATNFALTVKGKTLRDAFDAAVRDAQWERGHGGYTGTIAEKHSYVEIPEASKEALAHPIPEKRAHQLADDLLDDPRVSDKWGPAGVIAAGPETWVVFGWASE